MTAPPSPGYNWAAMYAGLPRLAEVNGMSLPEALVWYARNLYNVHPGYIGENGERRLAREGGYSLDTLPPLHPDEAAAMAANWQPEWRFLAMVLGKGSGLFALDDDDNGQWKAFTAEMGADLSPTAAELSGSGKVHLLYQRPDEEDVPHQALRRGAWSQKYPRIEVLSKNIMVVAPSPHHVTGQPNQWLENCPQRPLEPAPALLPRRAVTVLDEKITEREIALHIDREARKRLAAGDRQPVTLEPASAVWDDPGLTYLVRGMIPDTGIGTLFGERSTWKSFLALHLICCVVYGTGFLGYPVDRGGWCFYLLGEGQRGAGRRLRAAVSALPVPDTAPEKLAFVKIPFPLDDAEAVTDAIAQMKSAAAGEDTALVVFDAAADFYGAGANENLTADMNPVLAACKRISRELGCFVLLIAHSGHEGDHVRGTSRFGQAWDFEAQAERDAEKEGCGWLRVTKSKEDADGYAVPFRVLAQGGSLSVHYGHAGDDGEAAPAVRAAPLGKAALKTWNEVMLYVAEHGGAAGVTFRRIDLGTTGRQDTKRKVLDEMCRSGWAAEEDGPHNSKLYRTGETWAFWDQYTIRDEEPEPGGAEPGGEEGGG